MPMKHDLLSIYKTGWFYLLRLLWVGLGWYSLSGGFNWLNQVNRERLYQTLPSAKASSQVLRLRSSISKTHFDDITLILNKYEQIPVIFLGSSSLDFNAQLQKYLQNNPRSGKVILATESASSGLNIAEKEPQRSLILEGIDKIRYSSQTQVKWLTSDQIIYSPLLVDRQGGVPLVWRNQNKTYLTLLGEVIRQTAMGRSSRIRAGWHLELVSPKMSWPLGVSGVVYSAGSLPLGYPLSDFVSMKDAGITPQLIIIDDNSHPYADEVVRTAERSLERQYLYQSMLIKLVQWLLLLIGVVLVWLLRHLKVRYQSLYLVCFFIALWGGQYLSLIHI